MYLQVDLRVQPPVVSLEEPDDVTRFHIAAVGGADRGLQGSVRSSMSWRRGRLDGSRLIEYSATWCATTPEFTMMEF